MVLDIQTVHHILKNTAVQNVNKPFVYITDLTSPLRIFLQMENRLKISLLITKLSISQHIYVRYDIIRNISFNLR